MNNKFLKFRTGIDRMSTRLLLAAEKKNKENVERLINAVADINCSNSSNDYTTLHYASKYGWVEIVQSLLTKGAYIQVKTKHGDSPLLLAAENGHEHIVQLLINVGADINCTLSRNNYTVLHFASENGWSEIVQSLLNKGADIEVKTGFGDSALVLAAQCINKHIVELLINAGADINGFNKGYLLLHYASEFGWPEITQSLLNKGADIHVKTTYGDSPLLLAAYNGSTYKHIHRPKYDHTKRPKYKHIIELLINAGADINSSNDGYSALHYASEHGWLEMVQFLLNKGADIQVETKDDDSPLLLAAKTKNKEIVEYLINAGGADLNCSNRRNGYTTLHYAAKYGWFEIVQSLLSKGADIQVKTKRGFSPLLLAAEKRHENVVQLLICAGADINCSNSKNDYTTLHYASKYGWFEVAQSLLNKGTDIQVRTDFGDSALLLAAKYGHKDIVELLINAGADINGFNDGHSMLHYASAHGWLEIVQSLLNKGADIHVKVMDDDGDTALSLAAYNEHKDLFELLLHAGADVNWSNDFYNLLQYASEDGCPWMVESLLKKGANVDAKTFDGETSLLIALDNDNLEIAERLIIAGADVNVVSNTDNSPLSTLIMKSPDVKVVRLLINSGAYLKSIDYEKIIESSLLKEEILKDIELCSQAIINEFNHKDLPELYKLSMACRVLPRIENMRIVNNTEVAHEVLRSVEHEIQVKEHCNILQVRPIVLKILSVKSFLSYYDNMKKQGSVSNQMKRSAEFQHTKPSSKIMRFN